VKRDWTSPDIAHWAPVIGEGYARRIAPVKVAIRLTAVLGPFLVVLGVVIALTGFAGRVPWAVTLALLPFAALMVELVVLYHHGQTIAKDLNTVGHSVREPLFARSVADAVAWSARNGIDLTTVARVGNSVRDSGTEPYRQ